MSITKWTQKEINLAMAGYIAILIAQSSGDKFNKSKLYRELAEQTGRSAGSMEFRMMNISAWLSAHGFPVAKGLVAGGGANIGTHVEAMIELAWMDQKKSFYHQKKSA